MTDAMTIDTVLELFADEAAEFGEDRGEALARAHAALHAHDAALRAEMKEAATDLNELIYRLTDVHMLPPAKQHKFAMDYVAEILARRAAIEPKKAN